MSEELTGFAAIEHRGRALRLEYQWLFPERREAPLLVFLHEGLGSVALWRDYPRQLCAAGGCRGLVYSRAGYGRSTPRAPDEHWGPDFLEIQALEVLPRFLAAVGVDSSRKKNLWLFGHSDGGSIALIFAARHPALLAGAIVLAPHIVVEDLSISSISAARETYRNTGGADMASHSVDAGDAAAAPAPAPTVLDTVSPTHLRAKLARYHDDVDSAFWGWNDIWLDPRFRDWNIEPLLPKIECPILAVQGIDDEYGTMAQIDGIKALAPRCERLKLEACGHSPHRDQPQRLTAASLAFIREHSKPPRSPD